MALYFHHLQSPIWLRHAAGETTNAQFMQELKNSKDPIDREYYQKFLKDKFHAITERMRKRYAKRHRTQALRMRRPWKP